MVESECRNEARRRRMRCSATLDGGRLRTDDDHAASGGPRMLTESAPHRRAEALVHMARHAVAHAEDCHGQGGNRATLILGMPHQSLLDGLGTAGTPDGKRLPAAAARRMACDAGIIPAVYGADSQILDFGRLTRTIPAGLRRYIVARDGGCVWPGCDRPPAWTESPSPRSTGSKTAAKPNPNNLDLLCAAPSSQRP